jgi:hypothetical protein
LDADAVPQDGLSGWVLKLAGREPIQGGMVDTSSRTLAAYRAEIRTIRGRLICDISDLLDQEAMSVSEICDRIAARIASTLRQARAAGQR